MVFPQAVSVDVGSVRLTERFLHSDPVRAEEVTRDERRHRPRAGAACAAAFAARRSADLTLVGIAGTFTTLGRGGKATGALLPQRSSWQPLDAWTEVRRQIRLFQAKSIAERKQIAASSRSAPT